MKKILLALTAVIIMHSLSNAQTAVPGGSVSGIWTLAGSPYNIQGPIMVPNAAVLTIEPGVTVNFEGTYKLLILGQVLAIGTATDTISFIATDTTNGSRSIRFDGTPATNDTSKFIFCKVQYGKATGVPPDNYGGAFYFRNFSKAVISNCLISHCMADEAGGGIYCKNSSPVIINNTIANNHAWNVGGGISCDSCNSVILHNTIASNTTFGNGGSGIFCVSSEPIIMNNIITNNTNLMYSGGGIWCNGCNPTIISNTISNNSAPFGGGICCSYNSPTIINNTIINNNANEGGGILCSVSGNPMITNNTIANNHSVIGGGLTCQGSSNPTLINTILWGNTASAGGQQVNLYDEGSDPDFYFCDVQGGAEAFEVNFNIYTGIYLNNINSDPLFVAPSAGSGTGFNGIPADWSLQSFSPCINAGDPTGTYPTTDKAGNPRIADGVIDIGAFEYQWPIGVPRVISQEEFKIYPNPASDYLVIEMLKESVIEIVTLQGQIIKSIRNNFINAPIYVGNLSCGAYMIRAITDNTVTNRIFMKR